LKAIDSRHGAASPSAAVAARGDAALDAATDAATK
jgi:hypothetical protein